jgi:hypothetical protein
MSDCFLKPLSDVERLMVRLVGESSRHDVATDEIASYDLSADGTLFAICQANEVAPHVGHALREKGIELPAVWQAAHDAGQQRLELMMSELDQAAQALHEANIPMVALKNAGIARGLHECAACCPMGDLDVLVERRFFRQAHEIMVAAGFQFEFRSPLEAAEIDEAELTGGAEYWKPMPDGEKLWFELQWRPIAGRWLRPDQEPTAEELMHRSVAIEGTERDTVVRLLSPEDNLLQVAVHTAKHTYVRAPGFRLHTDVDRIVHTQSINWERFVAAVIDRQLATAVYFSLWMPAQLFDTPIPPEVLTALKPSWWKRAYLQSSINRAGLLHPERSKFGRIAYIAFNALLYDDLSGLLRGIFPDRTWMQEQYGVDGRYSIARAYLHRIIRLTIRRSRT